MDGSNGNAVSLLVRIADRLDSMDERQDAMQKTMVEMAVGQEQTRQELVQLRVDMNRGFAQVNARVDNVLVIAGRHLDDHEERIQVLEERVLGSEPCTATAISWPCLRGL